MIRDLKILAWCAILTVLLYALHLEAAFFARRQQKKTADQWRKYRGIQRLRGPEAQTLDLLKFREKK